MCNYCKNDRMINSYTTHVVSYKDYVIIIKNVPCLECSQCGEKYYSNDVALLLDKIVNNTKKSMQEISVIDYKKVA